MANSVTVKDVAREANVSIGTVSRVFNNHKNVTEEVRLRVLKAASFVLRDETWWNSAGRLGGTRYDPPASELKTSFRTYR